MASQPDILQQCFQDAAAAAGPALQRCIDHAVTVLQEAEARTFKAADRQELGTAWRDLLSNKNDWCQHYPRDLLAAFEASSSEAGAPQPAESSSASSRRSPVDLDSIALVDDSQMSEGIESGRLLQHILPMVEQGLAELDALISSAQGLPNVNPQRNPLRPGVFTQTLRTLIDATQVDAASSSLWIRHMGTPLGQELKAIYTQLVQQLEQANVPAASYRVLPTPASATGSRRGGANSSGGPAGPHEDIDGVAATDRAAGEASSETDPAAPAPSRYADFSNYEINPELFQEFLFNGGHNTPKKRAPSRRTPVPHEPAGPKSAPKMLRSDPSPYDNDSDDASPAVGAPPKRVDGRSQLNPQVWGEYGRPQERALVRTQLKKDATHVEQVLGLEVVRKLVSQVAQDPRLLVPVREAIVALEPSLLRLAMVDPHFFSDEGHPARRLMERVAQRSFKYNDASSPEFAVFFKPVTASFKALNARTEIANARPFGQALAELEHAWDENDLLEIQRRDNVLQAMRFAEQRQTQADQIALELSQRPDLDKVPGVVMEFLFGPWALVMAHARMTDQDRQVDPQGFGSVVSDLLWSVKRDVTLRRPAKLIEMIPGLLAKLNAGLDMLGQDPHERGPFFEALMKLHRPVLKLRQVKNKRDAKLFEESGALPLEPEAPPASPEQLQAKAAEQPWLTRQELAEAGFEDTTLSRPGQLTTLMDAEPAGTTDAGLTPLAAAPPSPAEAVAADGNGPSPEQILQSWRIGCWVDLYSRRRWLRAQLVWASTRSTLFMFVSHGGQPHSMTRRSCERLIKEQLLRPVDTHGVVAQALDALAAMPPSQPASLAPDVRASDFAAV